MPCAKACAQGTGAVYASSVFSSPCGHDNGWLCCVWRVGAVVLLVLVGAGPPLLCVHTPVLGEGTRLT
jgi:hypothetical protein